MGTGFTFMTESASYFHLYHLFSFGVWHIPCGHMPLKLLYTMNSIYTSGKNKYSCFGTSVNCFAASKDDPAMPKDNRKHEIHTPSLLMGLCSKNNFQYPQKHKRLRNHAFSLCSWVYKEKYLHQTPGFTRIWV